MNEKQKRAVDVMMTAALLFLMGYQFWGEKAHEWVGAGIFVLFAAHHALNWSWYKSLFRGKYSPMRIFQIGVDILTFLSMAVLMYSSIVLSRYVFAFLPIESGLVLARRLHILGSYWGFLMMSLHLGLHWNMVLGMIKYPSGIPGCPKSRTKTGKTKKTVVSRYVHVICFILGLAVALYGAWVFAKRDFGIYLFLKSEFVFLDYEESKILYYFDYLSLMGTCIFITHYIGKILRLFKRKKEGGQ